MVTSNLTLYCQHVPKDISKLWALLHPVAMGGSGQVTLVPLVVTEALRTTVVVVRTQVDLRVWALAQVIRSRVLRVVAVEDLLTLVLVASTRVELLALVIVIVVDLIHTRYERVEIVEMLPVNLQLPR